MGDIFLLMGKTNSYKEYIKKHCSYNPVLMCVDIWDVSDNGLYVVTGNMTTYKDLFEKFGDQVHPFYIDTPDDQILYAGIEIVKGGYGTYQNMCQTFIDECKEYEADKLRKINAVIIREDNACDACYSFIHYIKEILSKL